MDELIGKFAYKKLGFFSHLIGKIEKNEGGLTPYKLVTKAGTAISFRKRSEIVLVNNEEE